MNKKEFFIVFLVIIVFLAQSVLSFDSEIKIKSSPNNDLTVSILNQYTGRIVDPQNGVFNIVTSSNGEGIINYQTNLAIFKISIIYDNGAGEKVIKFFDDIPSEKRVYIDLTQSNPTPAITDFDKTEENKNVVEKDTNISEENTNNAVENTTIKNEVLNQTTDGGNKSITGKVIDEKYQIKLNFLYYIGILLVVGIVIFLFFKRNQIVSHFNFSNDDSELKKAEEEIIDAERKIQNIRSRNQLLKSMEDKINKDKKELKKL